MRFCFLISCLLVLSLTSKSQEVNLDSSVTSQAKPIQSFGNISNKSLNFINKKYSKLSSTVQKQNEKVLVRMRQKEEKLKGTLKDIDSAQAEALFAESKIKYKELQAKLKGIDKIPNQHAEYIPGLDSLQTIMKFLSQPGSNISGISQGKLAQIQSISSEVHELQDRLQHTNEIEDFIRSRESQLKSTLADLNFSKELLGINKEVYYYQQRLSEYRQLLNDRKKLEEKVFAVVRNLPAFKKFWQKNSFLAQLFPVPDSYGTTEALANLQTRVVTENTLTQRISAGGATNATPEQYVQQQMQQAQSELNKLKDKINKLGGGGSDMIMPDFKPNSQKTKSFLQRLEYSFNIQNQRSTTYLPSTSDLGFSVGYKIAHNKTLGVGASYKVGWGRGWNHVELTNQGVGIRNYVDIKAKGSIWITAAMEYNYLSEFRNLGEIKNLDIWQKSALLGITKKIKIGKKQNNLQLLYDFLSGQQVPKASALKFRIGWTL